LNVNIVLVVVSAQISRWDGTKFAKLGDTVSSNHRRNVQSVLQERSQMILVLTILISVKIVNQSFTAQSLVLTQC